MTKYSAILKPGFYQIGSAEYHAANGKKLKLNEDELLHFKQWSLLLWTDHPDIESIGQTDTAIEDEDSDSEIQYLLPKKLRNKSFAEVKKYYHDRFKTRKYQNIESMASVLRVDKRVLREIGAERWFAGTSK